MLNLSSLFCAVILTASVASAAAPSGFFSTAPQDPAIASYSDQIGAAPASAPAILSRILRGAGTQAASLAGPLTAAAIESQGVSPSGRRISAIVFAAVRAVPASVLDIVRAAVPVAPKSAAEIAAAAAAALPNPWKQVRYHRQTALYGRVDSVVTTGPAETGGAGKAMTLAEAIVQTAFDSETAPPKLAPVKERDFKGSERDFKDGVEAAEFDPPVGLAAIQSAVDAALVGDPGVDPKGISGVGDFGTPNFFNEPPPLHSTPTPTPPPTPTPTPPPRPFLAPISQ